MPYHLLLIQFLLAVLALFLLYHTIKYTQHILLVKKLQKKPLPNNYKVILDKIPYYKKIPPKYYPVLHYQMMLFIEEKNWEGIHTNVTLEMKVTVAFFACLMTMGNGKSYDNLLTILIYPYEYIAKEIENYGGILHKQKYILEGQSVGDSVIISWHSGKKQALHFGAHNVILHEFAHEFDFASGEVDGEPVLDPLMHSQWAQHIFTTFDKLSQKSLKGRYLGKYKFFGTYAGKNEAEFFAVASELFFQKPIELYKKFPNVYNILQKFYKLDTKEFF